MKAVQLVLSLVLILMLPATAMAAGRRGSVINSQANSQANNPGTLGAAVDVNVVNVEVYVTDANGRPVTDLRERDFEVREDGRRVSVSNFAALAGSQAARKAAAPAGRPEKLEDTKPEATGSEPWNLVVTIDNFDLHPASRTRALQQVRDFLAHRLAPGDRVMVASLDSGLRVWLPFSTDRAAIDASLKQVEGLAVHGPSVDRDRRHAYDNILSIQQNALTQPEPHACPQDIARPAHDFASARREEVFHTLGGLTVLVNSLSGVPGRKALLYVSDGLPVTPGEEVFQFLAEICGGGGAAGLGRQSIVGAPNTIEDTTDETRPSRPKPQEGNVNLDPMAVYDARSLGPGAYQAASQAPLDTQSYNVGKQLEALVAHANAQRVTLYALQASGLGSPGASDADAGPGDRLTQFPSIETAARTSSQGSLTALASGTGGRAILDVNDFGLDLARMQEDQSTYYSLGYTPSHNGDGKEHRITVAVKRSGIRLRYRESYRDKPVMEKAVDRTLAALFYGIDDNPLKIDLELGDQVPGAGGNFTVPVRLRIPLFKVAILDGDENYEGNLRLLVATRGADGRMTPVRQIPLPIHIPRKEVLTALGQYYVYTLTLQLAPGEQRVAVGVRDDVAATSSYLSRAVTVGTTASAAAGVGN